MNCLVVPEYCLIDNDVRLKKEVLAWQRHASIAIDTEFVRTNTYYPKLGLIQVAVDGVYYLIDPLEIKNYAPLRELFENPAVVKVFHACSEDLDVFQSHLGVLPTPIFDTQIGAALLGHGAASGYKNLVGQLFDVELPKEEQRSDWLQRPLSKTQLEYALLDVVYLETIYQQQLLSLKANNRLAWAQEESNLLLSKQRQGLDPQSYYQRIKGAARLSPEALAVLQALAVWREYVVRGRDIPRGFLLKDHTLVALAEQQPRNLQDLACVEGIHSRLVRQQGKELLETIERVLTERHCVPPLEDVLSKQKRSVLKKMQSLVAQKAENLQIEAGTLMSRKLLLKLLTLVESTGQLAFPSEMGCWKQDLLGKDLKNLLTNLGVLS